MLAAGRGRLPDEGPEPRRDRRGDPRSRRRRALTMKLTAANTAIVLDSTADFPAGAASASRTGGSCRSTSTSAGRATATTSTSGPTSSTPGSPTRPTPPTTSQPTPADFLAVYEELAARYERILSLQVSSTLSGTFASAEAAAAVAGDAGARGRHADGLGGRRDARASRSSAGSSAARRDEEIDALVERYRAHARPAVHRRHARVPRPRRPHRPRRRLRRDAAQRQADPRARRTGEVVPLKRVRGSRKALEEFGSLLVAGDRPTRRRCGSGSPTRRRPSGRRRSSGSCSEARPPAPDRGRRPRSGRSSGRTPARARSGCSGSTTPASAALAERRSYTRAGGDDDPIARGLLGPVEDGDWPRPRGFGRPERLDAAARDAARASAPALARQAARRSGSRRVGDLLFRRPRRYETAGRARSRSPSSVRRARRSRSPARSPTSGCGGPRRRLTIVTARDRRRDRIDPRHLVQPALARRPAAPRDAGAPARAPRPARLRGARLRPRRGARDRRLRSRLRRERAGALEPAARARARGARARTPTTCSTRCRPSSSCRSAATRSSALHFPRRPRRGRARAPAARARRARRAPARRRALARRASRRGRPLPPPGELVARYRAALPFALTEHQEAALARDRPRPRARACRCSGCSRATSARARRSSRSTRSCARVEAGRQGALMVADRDARRAALPDDRGALRRRSASRRCC